MTTSRHSSFWHRVQRHLEGGRAVFIALVVGHTRHSPGTSGARLLVAANGFEPPIVEGTIGGGIMEHRLIQRASSVLAAARRETEPWVETVSLQHSRKPTEGHPSGMICAGRQHNLYAVCRPEVEGKVVQRIADAEAQGVDGVIEMTPDGWRFTVEPPDFETPRYHLQTRPDGGFVYREELLNRRRLALFGGGHCALAVARLMAGLGYRVAAFEGPKKAPEPQLQEIVAQMQQVDDWRHAAANVEYPEITQALVLTSDFPSDVQALCGALKQPFPFIGVMGSRAKITQIRRSLEDEGFSAEDLQRLVAPVGLPMLSNTPQEIAVSIAAQLLQLRQEDTTI